DVVYSIKQWRHGRDPVLADLCRRFTDRDFFRVTFLREPPSSEQLVELRAQAAKWLRESGITNDTSAPDLYVSVSNTSHSAYERLEESILMIDRDNAVRELSEMADIATISALT